ncbi:MAG: D-2-hydroxyacid dehydrogenase [Chloroflexota bacterium]
MTKLLLLTSEKEAYRQLIEQANLPHLEFVTEPAQGDIVLGEPRLIRDELPHLSQVKWIQSMYAGVETLTGSGQRRDYSLTNARGVFGELMSEYVFGYLLAHEKKIFARHQAQLNKKYDRFESGMLRGKTLGLLGVGSIGAHLAGTAKHFGMQVWGYTLGSETSTQVDKYFHPTTPLESDSLLSDMRNQGSALQSFAQGLDYLIIVLPRTTDTDQIVSADLLNALPSHAILINVGRGNAVDEPALVEALNNNQIASAILDVTAQEPLPAEHPFWTTPNLLLTFHTSAISYPEDITKLFIENYLLYIAGKPLKYQVDFERGY